MPNTSHEPFAPVVPKGTAPGGSGAGADQRLWTGVGLSLGLGRVALGVVFWLAPGLSVRVAGLDRLTSTQADWLARMTAARDVAIGAGTAAAVVRPTSSPERAAWYLAGALADVGDTVSIQRGSREGKLSRLPALGASAGAAVAAAVGFAAAAHEISAARAGTRR